MPTPSPLDPVIEDEDNLNMNRVMTSAPKDLSDEDITKMVTRLRFERARFIEAGEKRPRAGEEKTGDADDTGGDA